MNSSIPALSLLDGFESELLLGLLLGLLLEARDDGALDGDHGRVGRVEPLEGGPVDGGAGHCQHWIVEELDGSFLQFWCKLKFKCSESCY